MAARFEVYKCEICGNIVTVLDGGKGELVCCGQPMKQMVENTVDAAVEKHVPVIEAIDGGVRINVGSAPHPMLDEHFIEWVEVRTEDSSYRKFLKPGGEPSATFPVNISDIKAFEYCNIHGLWKSD